VARDVITGYVEPALLVGDAGAHVSGRAQESIANGRAQASVVNGRAQVGASSTIEPKRASSLIEPTKRASSVVEPQASVVNIDRAQVGASSLIEPKRALSLVGGSGEPGELAGLSVGGIRADFGVSSLVCSVVNSPSMASRGGVRFGAAASGGADGWNAPAVAFRGDGEFGISSEVIAKQEHLPTHKLMRTVEENDASLVHTWRNLAGECGS